MRRDLAEEPVWAGRCECGALFPYTAIADIGSFQPKISGDFALNADAELVDARRPIFVLIGHEIGSAADTDAAGDRVKELICNGPLRLHDSARRLDIYELLGDGNIGRTVGGRIIDSVGADNAAGGCRDELVGESPTGAGAEIRRCLSPGCRWRLIHHYIA